MAHRRNQSCVPKAFLRFGLGEQGRVRLSRALRTEKRSMAIFGPEKCSKKNHYQVFYMQRKFTSRPDSYFEPGLNVHNLHSTDYKMDQNFHLASDQALCWAKNYTL